MKKLLLIALLLTSTPALAENAPPAGGPPAARNSAGPSPEQREQRFAEHKTKALERIGQHIAEMQKKQQCVQAADKPDALKACFPNRGKGRGFGHGGSEGDEQGPPG
jgi:hypothetical protein